MPAAKMTNAGAELKAERRRYCSRGVAQAQILTKPGPGPQYQQLKLALDVHAASLVVSRMVDGAKPQPLQTLKPADFLAWAKQQVALSQEVISCYEAGPTGFWLHRKLTALGVRNYVLGDRFKNRRQVGSCVGLTGGVSASGQSSADLSISSPLTYKTGRGRPASATGCPVSFVPINCPPAASRLPPVLSAAWVRGA